MPSPTQKKGAEYEALAESALVAAGYEVVARNWRGGGGEIDRIAWDCGELVFVEVRARESEEQGDPAETIGPAKQRHLTRAAAAYLLEINGVPQVRFDVISIVDVGEGPVLTLIQDAFLVSSTGVGAWLV